MFKKMNQLPNDMVSYPRRTNTLEQCVQCMYKVKHEIISIKRNYIKNMQHKKLKLIASLQCTVGAT